MVFLKARRRWCWCTKNPCLKKPALRSLPPPGTSCGECAKKLTLTKEDGTKQYGFAYPGTNAGNIWFRIVPAIWSAGGEIYSEDGKTSLVDSEATREAVRHYTSFYLDGLAPRKHPGA